MIDETPNQGEQETPQETERRTPLSLLAQEQYGQHFHGEAVENEPPDSPPEEPEQEAAPNDGEEPETPPDAAEELETQADEGGEESETVEYPLSDVAQMLGVDESNLDVNDEGRVVLRGKVDGEPVETPVKDLLDNYQKFTAADKRLEEAKQRAQQQRQEFDRQTEKLNEEFGVAARLIEKAEKAVDEDSSAVDWKRLRQDDPAEYAAKKSEFEERRKRVEQMKDEARRDYQQTIATRRQQAEQEQQRYLEAEHDALLKAIPEWKDQEQSQAEKTELAKYLVGLGFSQEEIGSASDHRIVVLARKAKLYDERQKKTDVAKKKVAKVPKVMKPGSPKPQDQRNKEKIDKQRERLKETGRLEDAMELLRARRVQ